MSSEAESRPKTGFWVFIVIMIALLSFFSYVWSALSRAVLGPTHGSMNIGPLRGVIQIHGIIVMLFVVSWLLSKSTYFRKRINLVSLSYMYMAITTVAFFSGIFRMPGDFDLFIESRLSIPVESSKYVPWLLAPPADVCKQLLLGHVPFPWDEWMPRILFWWIFVEMPIIFLISTTALLRRQWISIEKVPFPHVIYYNELLKDVVQTESKPTKLISPFLLAFIVGIIIQVPIYLAKMFPWFPDLYGTRTSCCETVWYVTPDHPLASIAGISCAERNPVFAAIAYFIPLKVLFNSWFWYFVFLVVMQILYSMGYYTGITSKGGCGRTWCPPSFNIDPPLQLFAFSNAGGIVGLTIFTLWLSRRHLIDTIKAALGLLPRREWEKEEPASYRTIWLLIILSFIATIAVYMSIGMSFVAALLIPISFFVIWFGNTRTQGLAGIWPGSPEIGHILYRLFLWPTAPEPMTSEFVIAQFMTRRMGSNVPDQGAGAALFAGFHNFKMADLTGVSNRTAFKITLLGAAIAPLMSFLAYLWCGYTFGLSNLGVTPSAGIQWWGANPDAYNTFPTPAEWRFHFIAGVIWIGALSILNARFIWFPFEPVGFIIATTYNASLSGIWTMFLAAWIAKELTFRIGGSRAYENVGIPAAVGLITGCIVSRVFFGALSIYRFFFPF